MGVGVVVTLAAPIAAGLGGHGLAMLVTLWAAFAAAKLLGAPWLLAGDAASLARLCAGMGVVVVALWTLGLGLSGLSGWQPGVPLWLPPALVLGAAALSRALWKPIPPDPRLDALLDDAIATLSARPAAAIPDQEQRRVEQVLTELETLPADTPIEAVESRLAWIGWGAAGRMIEHALLDRMAAGNAPRAMAVALAIAASDGCRIEDIGGDYPARAFVLLPDDPPILSTFARRCAAELAVAPSVWGALPTPVLLEERAARFPGTEAAADLMRLADLCRAHPEAGL
jgi:hypothetical protein